MKKILLLIHLFISVICFSQVSIKPIQKFLNNCDEVYGDRSEIGESLIKDLNQSLFDYFDIDSEYPTPLKKSLFRQTKEFKVLNDSFLKYKTQLRKTKYISFKPTSDYFEQLNYDVNKSGFLVYINSHTTDMTSFYKSFGKLIFNNLNTEVKYINRERKNEFIYIPCNKKYGSLIESDNSSTLVYIFFKPITVVPKRINIFGYVGSIDHLNSRVERIILTYKDEIIYNKTY
jgi:hypothetical protein